MKRAKTQIPQIKTKLGTCRKPNTQEANKNLQQSRHVEKRVKIVSVTGEPHHKRFKATSNRPTRKGQEWGWKKKTAKKDKKKKPHTSVLTRKGVLYRQKKNNTTGAPQRGKKKKKPHMTTDNIHVRPQTVPKEQMGGPTWCNRIGSHKKRDIP